MKLLLLHPGASWATADVAIGLHYGLKYHGAQIVNFRLDQRITFAHKTLHVMWRHKAKVDPDLPKPTRADVMYQAGVGALEMALREKVDAVVVVSGMLLHPDVVILMKRAGLRVVVLFTESPYDMEKELKFAAMVDGCWTNERTAVEAFQKVNPNSGYLPHAWHPERHVTERDDDDQVEAHDVVFVGTGFHERVTWFNSIDWTGIDLGLYGNWKGLGLSKQLKKCLRGDCLSNDKTAALYRRAKVGLNLYRQSMGWGKGAPLLTATAAESLSPRAYELAACGVFHLSSYRSEVTEVFGDLVPTFTTPTEAAALIRLWLGDPAGRARIAEQLPARVAEMSWVSRAATVLGDLQLLTGAQPAPDITAARSHDFDARLLGAAGG